MWLIAADESPIEGACQDASHAWPSKSPVCAEVINPLVGRVILWRHSSSPRTWFRNLASWRNCLPPPICLLGDGVCLALFQFALAIARGWPKNQPKDRPGSRPACLRVYSQVSSFPDARRACRSL